MCARVCLLFFLRVRGSVLDWTGGGAMSSKNTVSGPGKWGSGTRCAAKPWP